MFELIEGLSDDQRQVLTLKFAFDFSNAEVGSDPRQDRGRREVAAAPGARCAAAVTGPELRPDGGPGRHRRAAERGQDHALQRAHPAGAEITAYATVSARRTSGMAPIADERLDQVAEVVNARKVTPAAVRVVDVPGYGRQLLGGLREVDALLAVLNGWAEDAVARGRPRGAPARASRRRPRARRAAPRAGREAGQVGRSRAAQGGRGAQARCSPTSATGTRSRDYPGELPPKLEPLTTKPIVDGRERASAGSTSSSRPSCRSCRRTRRPPSATGLRRSRRVVPRLFEALGPDQLLHRRRQGDARVDAARGRSALDAATEIHTDIARGSSAAR